MRETPTIQRPSQAIDPLSLSHRRDQPSSCGTGQPPQHDVRCGTLHQFGQHILVGSDPRLAPSARALAALPTQRLTRHSIPIPVQPREPALDAKRARGTESELRGT